MQRTAGRALPFIRQDTSSRKYNQFWRCLLEFYRLHNYRLLSACSIRDNDGGRVRIIIVGAEPHDKEGITVIRGWAEIVQRKDLSNNKHIFSRFNWPIFIDLKKFGSYDIGRLHESDYFVDVHNCRHHDEHQQTQRTVITLWRDLFFFRCTKLTISVDRSNTLVYIDREDRVETVIVGRRACNDYSIGRIIFLWCGQIILLRRRLWFRILR